MSGSYAVEANGMLKKLKAFETKKIVDFSLMII